MATREYEKLLRQAEKLSLNELLLLIDQLQQTAEAQRRAGAEQSNRAKQGVDALRALTGTGEAGVTDASTTIDDILYGDKSPFADQ